MNNFRFPKRVLVLDANQRSALAVTRSLGRKGLQVITADVTPHSLAGASRFSSGYMRCPDVRVCRSAFLDWLREVLVSEGVSFVQPVTEVTVQVLLEESELFPAHCVLPFPNINTLKAVANKGELVGLAARVDVPVPASRLIRWFGAGLGAARISYPAVLKPVLSRVPCNGKWLDARVAVARDHEELVFIIETRPEFREHPFLLQEYIPGYGAAIFALYDKGRAVKFFAHRRIREKPPSGGVSVLCESIPLDPVMLEHAKRLLDAASWHGVAMVEFRVGPGGVPYLMEINTRFWGSLQLAIDSGVDFPWSLYQLGCGHAIDPPQQYLVGRRLRWFLGDLDSLYLRLRDPGTGSRQKIQSLLEFLVPRPSSTRHEVFRWSDPGPGIYEFQQYVLQLVRRRSG